MRIELVLWRDAGSLEEDSGWVGAEDVSDDNPLIQSVGFVVKETTNNLTLAQDWHEADDTTNGRSRIPVAMIISRTVIKESDK